MKKSLKFKKRFCNVGFTLVELVIVIAIVIILSVVSVPIYRNYVDKAKLAEGYALLGTILTAQKAYFSEYGNFCVSNSTNYWTNYDTVLGIDARGNKYFTRFYARGADWVDIKKTFKSVTEIPRDLVKNGNSGLRIWYDIETGHTFEEVSSY